MDHDVYVCYSTRDKTAADQVVRAIDDCNKVLTFYSPSYLDSKVCIEEFNIALCRHRESDRPVYCRSISIPPACPPICGSFNFRLP